MELHNKKDMNILNYFLAASLITSAASGLELQMIAEQSDLDIVAAAASPDDRFLIIALAKHDKSAIAIFDTKSLKVKYIEDAHKDSSQIGIAIRPDGKGFATTGNSKTYIWNFKGKKVRTISSWAYCLRFSPDSSLLALCRGLSF